MKLTDDTAREIACYILETAIRSCIDDKTDELVTFFQSEWAENLCNLIPFDYMYVLDKLGIEYNRNVFNSYNYVMAKHYESHEIAEMMLGKNIILVFSLQGEPLYICNGIDEAVEETRIKKTLIKDVLHSRYKSVDNYTFFTWNDYKSPNFKQKLRDRISKRNPLFKPCYTVYKDIETHRIKHVVQYDDMYEASSYYGMNPRELQKIMNKTFIIDEKEKRVLRPGRYTNV